MFEAPYCTLSGLLVYIKFVLQFSLHTSRIQLSQNLIGLESRFMAYVCVYRDKMAKFIGSVS